ncbi:hypothetical protein PLESTF_001070900 [Pleodorina starrii]|nr:hypothetical protein PLESTM_001146100 [Pleodorina starrii]GLC71065.1 hypothetical protein PLESTF_001070900 [Pleodorina starrii]
MQAALKIIKEQLGKLNEEVAGVSKELTGLGERLRTSPNDSSLLSERERLIKHLTDVTAERKALEVQLGSSTPAVHVASVSKHPNAAAMMRALLRLKRAPEPNTVLKLGPDGRFVLHPMHDALYVRACYRTLFEAVANRTPRKYIITGTPGIGKFCYKHKAGEVLFGSRYSFDTELSDPSSWWVDRCVQARA